MEKKSAQCQKQEIVKLQELYSIEEDFAGHHLTQADMNIERVQYDHKHTLRKSRTVRTPVDITTALSTLSVPLISDIRSLQIVYGAML